MFIAPRYTPYQLKSIEFSDIAFELYSAEDLWEYTLNPNKPYNSLRYYYTIRCNAVHRGKEIHSDEKMLRQSLTELLNIFNDVLDDTFIDRNNHGKYL